MRTGGRRAPRRPLRLHGPLDPLNQAACLGLLQLLWLLACMGQRISARAHNSLWCGTRSSGRLQSCHLARTSRLTPLPLLLARFVLAQGSPDDGLECFELIKDGGVNTGPLLSTPFFARQQPSAVQCCLQRHALVRIDGATPDRCVEGPRLQSSGVEAGVTGRPRNAGDVAFGPAAELIADPSTPPAPSCSDILADWRQLRAECGIDWLLAAPLACTPGGQHGSRLLGAVLVAGRGGAPSVDERWLEDWAGEMASNIYHASVQLMEVGGQAGRRVGAQAGGQGQVAGRTECCLRPLHHALAGQNPACFLLAPSCLPNPLPTAPAMCSARWRCWECCSHPECWSSWCPMPPRRRARCARLCCRMCQNTIGTVEPLCQGHDAPL